MKPYSNHINEIFLRDCVYLGGAAYPFIEGCQANILFSGSTLSISLTHAEEQSIGIEISLFEIIDINISGPGSVTTGGGFVGGGFGVEGVLEGFAIATALNLLTSRTKIHTICSIITTSGELHFHYGGMEPGALRIALSPVFSKLRHIDPEWIQANLNKFEYLLNKSIITEIQHNELVARLLSNTDEREDPLEILGHPIVSAFKDIRKNYGNTLSFNGIVIKLEEKFDIKEEIIRAALLKAGISN